MAFTTNDVALAIDADFHLQQVIPEGQRDRVEVTLATTLMLSLGVLWWQVTCRRGLEKDGAVPNLYVVEQGALLRPPPGLLCRQRPVARYCEAPALAEPIRGKMRTPLRLRGFVR